MDAGPKRLPLEWIAATQLAPPNRKKDGATDCMAAVNGAVVFAPVVSWMFNGSSVVSSGVSTFTWPGLM